MRQINQYNKKYRKNLQVKTNDEIIKELMDKRQKYINRESEEDLSMAEMKELAVRLGKVRFERSPRKETTDLKDSSQILETKIELSNVKSKDTIAPNGTFENRNGMVSQSAQDSIDENTQIYNSEGYKSRHLSLRTPKISLLPIINGNENSSTNAFIDAIKANNYEEYYKLEFGNLMEGLTDIHLRLMVHYETNLKRLEELKTLDDSCLNIVSKVGEKVKSLESDILELRESSKDIEILHRLKEDSKLLLGQKIEAEVRLKQLEEKYKSCKENQSDSGGAMMSTLKHNLEEAEKMLMEERNKNREANRKNTEIATQMESLYNEKESIRSVV